MFRSEIYPLPSSGDFSFHDIWPRIIFKLKFKENIPSLIIERDKFYSDGSYLNELAEQKIDFIVLAGFLWRIPPALLNAYPKRIVNMHPALLPKYGGQGMYGNFVHESVLASAEKESGITIHYVDDHYDHGDVILQVRCPVMKDDTAESLANRIHALEHANYPVVVEELVKKLWAMSCELDTEKAASCGLHTNARSS